MDSDETKMLGNTSNSINTQPDKDTEDYVRYLLEGSGAENSVDYAALRTQLEAHTSMPEITVASSNTVPLQLPVSSVSLPPDFLPSAKRPSVISSNDINAALNESIIDRRPSVSTTSKRGSVTASQISAGYSDVISTTGSAHESNKHLLRELSKQLESIGLPSLTPSLMTASPPKEHFPNTLTLTQADDLKNLIQAFMRELDKRSNQLENATSRIAELEIARSQSIRQSVSQKMQTDDYDGLKSSLSQASTQIEALRNEVAQLKLQNSTLKSELDSSLYQVSVHEKEKDAIRFKLQDAQRQQQVTVDHNGRILEDLRARFGHRRGSSDNDAFLLQVIQAYEVKLNGMKKYSSDVEKAYAELATAETQTAHRKAQSDFTHQTNTSNASESHQLEKRLEDAFKSLRESQRETEVLKLRLASQKDNSSWIEDSIREEVLGKMSTRELIRRDKMAWKSQLKDVDELSLENAKDIIKEFCSKLSIKTVHDIPQSLHKITSVVRLIDQMENYIREVDSIVRVHIRHGAHDPEVPLKLPIVLKTIRRWASEQSETLDSNKFYQSIHDILGIEERKGSGIHCIEEIKHLSNIAIQRGSKTHSEVTNDVSEQAVRHFIDLFEIRSAAGVLPKMNDLYVFWSEVNAGLGRLRDALSLERNVQPGRVLIHAAEALEHDLSLKRSVTQINQSSVQSEQGPASPTKSTTSFAPSTYSENIRIEVASPDRPSVNRNMLSGLEMLVGKTLAVESNQSPDPDH